MDTLRPAIDQNPLNAVDMVKMVNCLGYYSYLWELPCDVEHDDVANEVGDFDAQALEMVLLDLLAVNDFE